MRIIFYLFLPLLWLPGVTRGADDPLDYKQHMTPRVAGNPCPDPAGENFKIVRKGSREDKLHAYLQACKTELGPLPDLTMEGIEQKVPVGVKLNGKNVEKMAGKYFYTVPGQSPQEVETKYVGEKGELLICDNPSLAGLNTPCNFDSSLIKYKSPTQGTYWVGIERPGTVMGVIGWNRKTGASCFIQLGEGKASAVEFGKFSSSSARSAERSHSFNVAMKGTASDNCLKCHTGADPFVADPHISDALKAVGITDVRKNKSFNAGEYQYRVPGIHFTDLEHRGKIITVRNPDGSKNNTCSPCHVLTTGRLLKRALSDDLRAFPSATEGKPHFHNIPAWMTVEDPDETQTYAVKQLRQFANQELAPGVTVDETTDHLPDFPPPEKPIGGSACAHPGFVSLKWNQTEKNLKWGDDVRFTVTARMTFETAGPDGPTTHTETKVWEAVGLGAGNCAFPRSDWEFKHQMPEVPNLKKIVYEIKPVRLSVNDNGPKAEFGSNYGPSIMVELPLGEKQTAPQRWPNCEGGEAHENPEGKNPAHAPSEPATPKAN